MNRMPTLFVSHGAPTFALEPGHAGEQLTALGRTLDKPRVVVIVSPHWRTRSVEVTSSSTLETIHDFGGFPSALYQIQYPAVGDPSFAQRTVDVLSHAGIEAKLNMRRGLDHGAWVPLLHLYPDADVPVAQVSMPVQLDSGGPAQLDSEGAYRLGQALAPLAQEGALIIGSGSLTHNLYEFRGDATQEAPYAREFTTWVRSAVTNNQVDRLRRTLELAPHAQRAHPTDEHLLPLLIALGSALDTSKATVLDGGIRHGVLAMESYLFGRDLGNFANTEPIIARTGT